jgi:NitT/TauT family transport system permease protein
MILALILSVIFALAVGIWAARSRRAESVILPLLDILQSIPILGFFPVVIAGIYGASPNIIGANLAVIFLIFTSMSWNIAFGVYEAVKAIPQDYADLLSVSQAGAWQRLKSLYVPAAMSRVAYNTQTSWAVGLFYLVASEIITIGCPNPNCYGLSAGNGVNIVKGTFTVPVYYGLGIGANNFFSSGDLLNYYALIIALILAVVVWRFVFLREFALWSEKYKMIEEPRELHRDPIMRIYSWVNQRSVSRLFLLTQGMGVTRFTSVISRFRKGIKYALLIFVAGFLLLLFSSLNASGSLNLGALPSAGTVVSDEAIVLYALGASFIRVWYVYAICVAIGLPLGIVISLNFRLYDIVSPILEVISSVPAPILLPAIVLIPIIGGASEVVAAIVIILSVVWYIIFNVMAGVRTLPADLKDLPHVFGVGRLSAWRNVYIPGAITGLVTGSITAIGGAWNALIIAEYFTTTTQKGTPQLLTQVGTGIGKTIVIANNNGDLLTVTLAIASMTTLVVLFNLTVWRRLYHYATKRYTYNR